MNGRDRRKKVGCRGVSLIPAENRSRRPRSPELPRIRSAAFHRIRGASALYRNRRLRRRASRIEKDEFPAGQEGRRPMNGHGQQRARFRPVFSPSRRRRRRFLKPEIPNIHGKRRHAEGAEGRGWRLVRRKAGKKTYIFENNVFYIKIVIRLLIL